MRLGLNNRQLSATAEALPCGDGTHAAEPHGAINPADSEVAGLATRSVREASLVSIAGVALARRGTPIYGGLQAGANYQEANRAEGSGNDLPQHTT
jgi:hypothetical protein